MKIVISPAKSLDFESKLPTKKFTEAKFLSEAEHLNRELKKESVSSLSTLMGISANLSQLNHERNQDWQLPFSASNARPAVYAFAGDVYTGLDAYTISSGKIALLQDKLRILSGLYGLLKPLDLIQPYRLEMGTKLKVKATANLYQFWGDKITSALNDELNEDAPLVNLASNEYFKAVKPKLLNASVITPVFKDFKNGELKMISFYAKKARGSMVRFIIDANANSLDDLKAFDYQGYKFSDTYTSKENEPVFIR
jgi:hypothetical protein